MIQNFKFDSTSSTSISFVQKLVKFQYFFFYNFFSYYLSHLHYLTHPLIHYLATLPHGLCSCPSMPARTAQSGFFIKN